MDTSSKEEGQPNTSSEDSHMSLDSKSLVSSGHRQKCHSAKGICEGCQDNLIKISSLGGIRPKVRGMISFLPCKLPNSKSCPSEPFDLTPSAPPTISIFTDFDNIKTCTASFHHVTDLSISAKTCEMCRLLWIMLRKSNPMLVKKAMEYNDETFVSPGLEYNSDGVTDDESFSKGRRVSLKIDLTPIPLHDLFCHDKEHSALAVEVMYSMEAKTAGSSSRRSSRKSPEVYNSRDILLLYSRGDSEEFQRHGIPADHRMLPEKKLSLIRNWVSSTEGRAPSSKILPSRLLHFTSSGNMRLVQTSDRDFVLHDSRYIALSHRWGSSQHFKTTKATFNERSRHISTNDLPKTFRDAVHVSSLLGFSYLWIDALCIIQDDIDDWKNESGKMGDVFAHASVVLFAHCARDDSEGFLAKSLAMRPSVRFECSGLHLGTYQLANMNSDVTQSPLCKRGWVLQERFLASRSIHFTAGHIYFETGADVSSEDGDLIYSASRLPTLDVVNKRLDDSILSMETKMRVSGDFGPSAVPELRRILDVDAYRTSTQHRLETPTSEWLELITMYSGCGLTKPEDKLVALLGMAKKIHQQTRVHYLAGLWMDGISQGLLWLPEHSGLRVPAIKRAPSWSWAAYDGRIQFPGQVQHGPFTPLVKVVHVWNTSSDVFPLSGESCSFLNGCGILTLRGTVTALNPLLIRLSQNVKERSQTRAGWNLKSPVRVRRILYSRPDRDSSEDKRADIGWISFDREDTSKAEKMFYIYDPANRPSFCFVEIGATPSERFGLFLIATCLEPEVFVRVGCGQLWPALNFELADEEVDIRIA